MDFICLEPEVFPFLWGTSHSLCPVLLYSQSKNINITLCFAIFFEHFRLLFSFIYCELGELSGNGKCFLTKTSPNPNPDKNWNSSFVPDFHMSFFSQEPEMKTNSLSEKVRSMASFKSQWWPTAHQHQLHSVTCCSSCQTGFQWCWSRLGPWYWRCRSCCPAERCSRRSVPCGFRSHSGPSNHQRSPRHRGWDCWAESQPLKSCLVRKSKTDLIQGKVEPTEMNRDPLLMASSKKNHQQELCLFERGRQIYCKK